MYIISTSLYVYIEKNKKYCKRNNLGLLFILVYFEERRKKLGNKKRNSYDRRQHMGKNNKICASAYARISFSTILYRS